MTVYLYLLVVIDMKLTTLQKANLAFKNKSYEDAYSLYLKFVEENPSFENIVDINIAIAKSKIEKESDDVYLNWDGLKRIAIVVHVFYLEVWDRIEEKLLKLNDFEYDLFITSSKEKCSLLKSRCESKFKNVEFLEVENCGMDVLPFIKSVKKFNLTKYDFVLKLHTKNEKTQKRKLQGDIIFSSLLNEKVLSALKSSDSDSLSIFPGFFTRSIDYMMYGNRKYFEKIIDILDIESKGQYFSAGTMFWISGASLNPLVEKYGSIDTVFNEFDAQYETGADSTPAHAFERVFGVLVDDENLKLSFRMDSKNRNYCLVKASSSEFLQKNISKSDSADHIYLDESATLYSNILAKSDFFEKDFYCKSQFHNNNKELTPLFSPAVHAILYGDPMHLDPSSKFSTSFYKVSNLDILRNRACAVVHYMKFGKKEINRKFFPTYSDMKQFLIAYDFLEESNNVLRVKSKIYYEDLNYLCFKLNSIKKFDDFLNDDYYQKFKRFLIYILDSYYSFQNFKRVYENGDFIACDKVADNHINDYGKTRESLECKALSLLMNNKFKEALSYYDELWVNYMSTGVSRKAIYGGIPYDEKWIKLENKNIFNHVSPNSEKICDSSHLKICVYTSLYGGFDVLPPILNKSENIDYICFSDRSYPNADWKVVVVPPEFDDNNLNAKRFKILPHKYLEDYDASLFVDANTYFYGNLEELIKVYLSSSDFVMFKHPCRDDLYKEVATIIGHKRHSPELLIKQIEHYHQMGLPVKSGMVEGSFIWRKHRSSVLNIFMEEWWSHILKFSKRDQLSLGYLMWKNNLRPRVLPDTIGDSRTNIYFKKFPHQSDSLFPKKIDKQRKEFIFVYNESCKNQGSTIMRGFQLHEILLKEFEKNGIEKLNGVSIHSERYAAKNSILYLTKGFLKNTNDKELEEMKKNNNVLIADFVDDKINHHLINFIDILIASSITAFIEYKNKFPKKRVFLLTHHVDPRVEKICAEKLLKSGKIAYFGEVANTILTNGIDDIVEVHSINTSGKDKKDEWISSINKYHYHYAVRRKRGIDGHKPFTKGFTAACADALLIIDKEVDDVKYYLGNHYPFYVDKNPETLNNSLRRISSVSNSTDVEIARAYINQVRQRSTSDFIINEFRKIINSIFI